MFQQKMKSQGSQWDENDFAISFISSWTAAGESPRKCDLHTLSSLGNMYLQKILGSGRASVSLKNRSGWTPLMYACYNGCTKSVESLINSGILKDAKNNENVTALMIAACYGNSDAIRYFPEKIHLNAEDNKGWTALFYAVSYGHQNSATALIQNGSNVNKVENTNGYTVAMIAAMNGDECMLKILINSGADLTIKSTAGHTAKSLAVSKGHHSTARILDGYFLEELAKKGNIAETVIAMSTCKINQPALTKPHPALCSFSCPVGQIVEFALKEINLSSILKLYNLEKYCTLFNEHKIDLSVFLTLTEEDLKELGIKLLGPRRKMSLLIQHLHNCDTCQDVTQQYYKTP